MLTYGIYGFAETSKILQCLKTKYLEQFVLPVFMVYRQLLFQDVDVDDETSPQVEIHSTG